MTALKRRIVEREDGQYWAVYGMHGVISWGQLKGTRELIDGPIGVHAPQPQWGGDLDTPSDDCPFLEGVCYVDTGYLAGDRLGRKWKNADRDDEVIWRELEAWYAGRLEGGQS